VGIEGAAKGVDVLATAVWSGLGVEELELLDLGYAPPFSGAYDPLLIATRQVAGRVRYRSRPAGAPPPAAITGAAAPRTRASARRSRRAA
jgi:hypothetical protein